MFRGKNLVRKSFTAPKMKAVLVVILKIKMKQQNRIVKQRGKNHM